MIAVDASVNSLERTGSVGVGEILALLSGPAEAAARRELEDLAIAICDQARRRGWRACAGWTDENVKVRLQNGDTGAVKEFLQTFAARAERIGAHVSVKEADGEAHSICALEDAPILWGTVVQARLTRDLLCGLPEGAFVASASEEDRIHSVGRVGPFNCRAQQWQRAQFSGLDGTMCRVFWSEADYNDFVGSR